MEKWPSNWALATGSYREHESPHVLIIDGDSLLRWSVSESLAASGCLVSEAANGVAALNIASGLTPPDVAVVDSDLADVDGLTLISALKALLPACSAILMTTDATPELAHHARRAGAVCVLEKPFGMMELVTEVLRTSGALARSSRVTSVSPPRLLM